MIVRVAVLQFPKNSRLVQSWRRGARSINMENARKEGAHDIVESIKVDLGSDEIRQLIDAVDPLRSLPPFPKAG
jgi:hypothetical protein